MTLQEAHKTGLNYRRKGHLVYDRYSDSYATVIPLSYALADDWEVAEQRITATQSLVSAALKHAAKEWDWMSNDKDEFDRLVFNYLKDKQCL